MTRKEKPTGEELSGWCELIGWLWHHSRVRAILVPRSDGVAALNHRLMAGTPLVCWLAVAVVTLLAGIVSGARAETVSIVIASNAAPRVEFGVEKLVEALKAVNLEGKIVRSEKAPSPKIWINPTHNLPVEHEGFQLGSVGGESRFVERAKKRVPPRVVTPGKSYGVGFGSNGRDGDLYVASADDSGAL